MAADDPEDDLIEAYEEESCRDFLVDELGVEVARFYRYTEGIHEVQRRVMLRYGEKNYAKAMNNFYDLLEQEDNASGLGDEGDAWRSWRHDYTRRRVRILHEIMCGGLYRVTALLLMFFTAFVVDGEAGKFREPGHTTVSGNHPTSPPPSGAQVSVDPNHDPG